MQGLAVSDFGGRGVLEGQAVIWVLYGWAAICY